jgi:hypothetical protein
MVNLVTTIGYKESELRIYVSVRDEGNEIYGRGILIAQGDTVLVDSEDRARKLVAAIKRRAAELGWYV